MAGTFCSTAGETIRDRESLAEHYKSDFHRYNLKRKVAGLPPVTKEWFEARKAQLLAGAQAGAAASTGPAAVPPGHVRVWFDPLTRKTFRSEQTYAAHIRSNKYQELVRKSGEPAPAPVISIRKLAELEAPQASTGAENKAAPRQGQLQATPGFKVFTPSGGLPTKADDKQQEASEDEDDNSGWETASDDDEIADLSSATARMAIRQQQAQEATDNGNDDQEEKWEEWDVRRSLFDNNISRSFEANLEYMWKKFGFYFPDAEYLKDPEGLLKYLGAKIRYGRVPLYSRGDDDNAKQFTSLHGVQRHMIDSGRCKMCYEDNEEEYADFYDYGDEEEEDENQLALTQGGTGFAATASYELVVAGNGGPTKILGTREFARYYRQRHRANDDRQIVLVNTMLSKYRSLGISLRDEAVSLETKKLKTKSHGQLKWESKRRQGLFMRNNINLNLPKNVPY